MTAGWCFRTVRAAVFAAVCVLFAALGHVLVSGTGVAARALVLGAVATGAVGWCLAGRERGLPLIVTLVMAAQTGLHTAFSYAPSAPGGAASLGGHHMGASHMGSMRMRSMHMGGAMDMESASMGSGPMGSPHMNHMAADHMALEHMGLGHTIAIGTLSALAMSAAHLLAAFLTGLWLAYGEKAAFRLLLAVAGWLANPLRLLLCLVVTSDHHPETRRPHRSRSDRAPRLFLVHAITTRGPPPGTAVI
ncbi:hypothetical protein [Streptomyces sp. NPDC059597]|uniref:hypothetical protein n=1 Tax=Streptomyces sp. NPDC059597 TaxID=3346879 RepID=UPI0036CB1ED9